MLSDRGLCDELITRPEKSYRLWCVVVCDLETSRMRRPYPTGGGERAVAPKEKNHSRHKQNKCRITLITLLFNVKPHGLAVCWGQRSVTIVCRKGGGKTRLTNYKLFVSSRSLIRLLLWQSNSPPPKKIVYS